MTWLLDTCTVSDFVKGQAGVLARLKTTPPQSISISAVTRMEIEYGLQLHPARTEKLAPVINAFLASIAVLPFENADAKAAGTIRAVLQKRGRPIGAYDIMIAGTALARGLTVVTSNVGEFERIEGLRVENWR
ncbi:MAG: tRNA(fMet)-specific endonuclease VapC [Rhodocyclaceae bacterium]|nr:MAG: type II toxin-antitoxin system VapC family toxin [Rhodocyclaceae bacterium]MBV6407105.1 tRNA(fMet)-specific endonuclease VapC [Rhodocyclaceae bacterium]CAG0926601.1 tRNA(fMet)-specific endonuclease VapC [Rhodocyclaceae bacterium]